MSYIMLNARVTKSVSFLHGLHPQQQKTENPLRKPPDPRAKDLEAVLKIHNFIPIPACFMVFIHFPKLLMTMNWGTVPPARWDKISPQLDRYITTRPGTFNCIHNSSSSNQTHQQVATSLLRTITIY